MYTFYQLFYIVYLHHAMTGVLFFYTVHVFVICVNVFFNHVRGAQYQTEKNILADLYDVH